MRPDGVGTEPQIWDARGRGGGVLGLFIPGTFWLPGKTGSSSSSLGSSWLQLPASAWYFPKKESRLRLFKRLQGDAWATAPLSCEVTGSVAGRAWECGGGRVYGPRELAAWVGGPRFPHLQRPAWGGPWRCVGPHKASTGALPAALGSLGKTWWGLKAGTPVY